MSDISIKDINDLVLSDEKTFILQSEKKYHDLVDMAASKVYSNKNVRILLLAGPSGSGKTTTANLISDRIKAHGESCIVVSLDDFYRSHDDPGYPRFPDGSLDYERVEALDLPLLTKTLCNIAQSKEFLLPKYDFKISKRVEERMHSPMPDGCVIIEGLHAINPLIFSYFPPLAHMAQNTIISRSK